MTASLSTSNIDDVSAAERKLPELQKSGNRIDTPLDESKPNPRDPESGEKFRLRTLGDGPCAPEAAVEAAQGSDDEEDLEVSPGYKGWINLVGVSRENTLNYPLTNQAVAVNMLCCEFRMSVICMTNE
jgi:hypothetical protein